jgi:hypothetical protein
MGDTQMNDDEDLNDYNVDPEDLIAGKTSKDPEDILKALEWTFEDEERIQSPTKYGDEVYYEPFTPKLPRGSIEDIQHRLRITGIRLRKDLNHSRLTDPDKWTALRRPASLHTAQRTLAEMLMSIPPADQIRTLS